MVLRDGQLQQVQPCEGFFEALADIAGSESSSPMLQEMAVRAAAVVQCSAQTGRSLDLMSSAAGYTGTRAHGYMASVAHTVPCSG